MVLKPARHRKRKKKQRTTQLSMYNEEDYKPSIDRYVDSNYDEMGTNSDSDATMIINKSKLAL